MSYKISIIIPTLNEEYCLPLLLRSLTKQKVKNFEVIVVDAISEDETKTMALKFQNRLPLRFYDVTERNVAYQKNYGAARAKGEYLFFLDADFLLFNDFTANLEKHFNKSKHVVFLPHLVPDKKTYINKLMFFITNTSIALAQIVSVPLSAGGPIIIKNNLFFKLEGYSEHLFVGEDHDLIYRVQKQGVKAKVLKEIILVLSLRRQRKEGNIVLIAKYTYSGLQKILFGRVRENSYAYEMGGHRYDREHYA